MLDEALHPAEGGRPFKHLEGTGDGHGMCLLASHPDRQHTTEPIGHLASCNLVARMRFQPRVEYGFEFGMTVKMTRQGQGRLR